MPREPRDHEWERNRQEDEYFHKADAELIDRMRRQATMEEQRRLIAETSGIRDQQILNSLQKLGFNHETVTLLYLVPLVQVAWSSGSVTQPERELLFQAARLRGVHQGSPAYSQLCAWVDERPDEAFLQSSLFLIRDILQSLPSPERQQAADRLIEDCDRIASASRSLLGLGPKICAGERQALGQIVRALAQVSETERSEAAKNIETTGLPAQLFQRILLVVHEEGAQTSALRRALELAKANGGLLTVAGVYPSAQGLSPAAENGDEEKNLRNSIERRMQDFASIARREEINTAAKMVRGVPFFELRREILQHGHDLVVVEASYQQDAKSKCRGMILRLVRECPCLVWVIRDTPQTGYGRILAAVDQQASGESSSELNRRIIDLAISIARAEHGELHVVRTRAAEEDASKKRQQWLVDSLEEHQLGGVPVHVHLFKEDAGHVIPEFVARHGIGLVVMAPVGRAAEEVLKRASCSLLVVKPHGFVSTVTERAA